MLSFGGTKFSFTNAYKNIVCKMAPICPGGDELKEPDHNYNGRLKWYSSCTSSDVASQWLVKFVAGILIVNMHHKW